jgi:hypothetical protein
MNFPATPVTDSENVMLSDATGEIDVAPSVGLVDEIVGAVVSAGIVVVVVGATVVVVVVVVGATVVVVVVVVTGVAGAA